jgi:hypothetical protein
VTGYPVDGPHDAPSAAQLVEAVREFLQRDVMGATEGRVKFHTRVAVNVLAMVGYANEAALAAAIRDGSISDLELAGVAAFVRQTVRAKLEVANPWYLESQYLEGGS